MNVSEWLELRLDLVQILLSARDLQSFDPDIEFVLVDLIIEAKLFNHSQTCITTVPCRSTLELRQHQVLRPHLSLSELIDHLEAATNGYFMQCLQVVALLPSLKHGLLRTKVQLRSFLSAKHWLMRQCVQRHSESLHEV